MILFDILLTLLPPARSSLSTVKVKQGVTLLKANLHALQEEKEEYWTRRLLLYTLVEYSILLYIHTLFTSGRVYSILLLAIEYCPVLAQ